MEKIKEQYTVNVRCTNCGFSNAISKVPKGTLVESCGCPNCECKTLTNAFKPNPYIPTIPSPIIPRNPYSPMIP